MSSGNFPGKDINNPDNLTNKDLDGVAGGGKGDASPRLPEQEEKKKVEPIGNADPVIPDELLKKVDGGAKAPEEQLKDSKKSTPPDRDIHEEPTGK